MQIQELSIPKSSLTPEELSALIDSEKIGIEIAKNIAFAQQSLPVIEKRGIFQYDDFSSLFSLTGSMRVPSLEVLGLHGKDFFTSRENRFSQKPGEITHYLRGLRYIVAIDPNLSVPQKLNQLRDDYVDGISALSKITTLPERQHLEIAPILDYVKTVAITVLNGFIYGEKSGDLHLDDLNYQDKRRRLIEYANSTVRAYYLSLLDGMTGQDLAAILDSDGQRTLFSTINESINGFRSFTFSSGFIVRPESTHPLTILGTAYLAAQRNPDTETVIGLPAGSTELACAVAQGYNFLYNKTVDLTLIPFSLHSLKREGGSQHDVVDLANSNTHFLRGKNVLIVDDNTSTGRTLQQVSSAIQRTQPRSMTWVISEADIIRSRIDRNRPGRTHVANPVIYDSSVGILPVSRIIKPKHDLKELMEQRQLAKHYLKKAQEASDIKDKIKYQVYADGLIRPIKDVLEGTEPADRIDTFEDTWLSNFQPVQVEYHGRVYPSVEHAYQAAKFIDADLTTLSAKQRLQINELLLKRGYDPKDIDLPNIFTNTHINSGTIKLLSQLLQEYNFVPQEWDSQRADVMIALLIQKFQDPIFANKLLATGDKILIEGNSWNDTFWGVCNNRGRNILGRILMNIRDKLQDGSIIPTIPIQDHS